MEPGILKNEANIGQYLQSMACAEHHTNTVKVIEYLE